MSMIGKFKEYVSGIYTPFVEAIKPKWIVADHDDEVVATAFIAALKERIVKELGAFGMKIVTDAVNDAEKTHLPGPQKFTYAIADAETTFAAQNVVGVSGVLLVAATQCAVMELQAAQALAKAN